MLATSDNAPLHQRFQLSVDVITHHRATLHQPLTCLQLGCQGCGAEEGLSDPSHVASCPCGIAASNTLHHPVRDLLAAMCKSVFGSSRVLVDNEMQQTFTLYSQFKRPDIVVQDAAGPGAHWIIDVKTACADGTTHLAADHTDRHALGALRGARARPHERVHRRRTLARRPLPGIGPHLRSGGQTRGSGQRHAQPDQHVRAASREHGGRR